MNEEIPQQPVIPDPVLPIVPEQPQLEPKLKKYPGPVGVLDKLPKEVKEDMEEHMRKTNPPATMRYMNEKYGVQFPQLLPISRIQYYRYWKKCNVKLSKELALQKASAAPPPEILNVIEKITDPDVGIADKRAALTALYHSCATRSKMLEERQTNFIDPMLEQLILANRKEQHAILKTVATLSDQLSKDADKDWLSEASTLLQVILVAVYNAYRLTHTDQTNLSMFQSTVGEKVTEILKNYKQERENLKKESN